MKFRFLLFIFLFLLVFGVNAQTASAEFSRVTVLQTGDSAGHLFACPS
jgi:hypothetical protein